MSGLSVCLRARALHRFVKALCSPLRFALIECGEASFDLEFQKSEYSLHELTVPVTSTLCCSSSSRWVLAVLSSRSDAAVLQSSYAELMHLLSGGWWPRITAA